MARSIGEAAKPEDTGRRVICRPFPVKVEATKGGCRDLRKPGDADIGPPEKPREYTGERLKPGKAWKDTRPRATGKRK